MDSSIFILATIQLLCFDSLSGIPLGILHRQCVAKMILPYVSHFVLDHALSCSGHSASLIKTV